jgi:hypothetical protein
MKLSTILYSSILFLTLSCPENINKPLDYCFSSNAPLDIYSSYLDLLEFKMQDSIMTHLDDSITGDFGIELTASTAIDYNLSSVYYDSLYNVGVNKFYDSLSGDVYRSSEIPNRFFSKTLKEYLGEGRFKIYETGIEYERISEEPCQGEMYLYYNIDSIRIITTPVDYSCEYHLSSCWAQGHYVEEYQINYSIDTEGIKMEGREYFIKTN